MKKRQRRGKREVSVAKKNGVLKSMNAIQRKKISTAEDANFPKLWRICKTAFPLPERRVLEQQLEIFEKRSYNLDAWIQKKQVIGFMGWWDFEQFRYVEHYAINPEYRARGYGSSFLQEWLSESRKKVILEIEPVRDEKTQRRLNFYKKLAFVENDYKHLQPPFHKGGKAVLYEILSYPEKIQPEIYNSFVAKQKFEVMPQIE
ncbi:MAG: GNAT family N-acetyltransferase [Methanosarcinaceae archaeon]|nr:GNAT family N-acetyltransferase [Methanosarcinaceae archaeon]